uniref:Secreted protein n=1 Tax=Amblyomma americanum TaxID=6943 RepID=A0A0C9SFH5_AMBAM
MLRTEASCFLILLVTTSLVGGMTVDFMNVVAKYVRKLNETGNVTAWGVQQGPTPPSRNDDATTKQELTAQVGGIMCHLPKADIPLNATVEMVSLYWRFDSRIKWPSRLPVNVNIPQVEHNRDKRTNVTFDINNKSWLLKRIPDKNGIQKAPGIRMIQKSCTFTTKVYFKGHFWYATKNTEEEVSYHTVDVKMLQNSSKAFSVEEDMLTYSCNSRFTMRILYQQQYTHKVILIA